MIRCHLLCVLIAVVLAKNAVAEEAAPSPQHLLLTIKMLEQREGRDRPVTLNEPSMHCIAGQKFDYLSGGEAKLKFSDDPQQYETFGLIFSGKLTAQPGGRYELKLKYTLGDAPREFDQKETEVSHSETWKLRTILKPKSPLKIRLAHDRWLELRLVEIDPQF
ncbi:hypothetical protein ACYFX5_05695 [Bremerella sp. T1]|uniref:hypothetical protein n=1 Tax=Bremerella sp. TYQ1 TaxID=3119568 RepID=UPI001CCA19CA|nr:hypothetical protein [Bremerella volcania]UBM37751.1 hypothetical protein LA756_07635 [Bremerella volcania]